MLPRQGLDYDFRFAVHPESWDVVIDGDKADVLPELMVLKGRPGLDGCIKNGDTATRFAVYRNRGYIEIADRPVEAFGEEVPSYRVEYDVQGGTTYRDAWVRPRIYGGNTHWDVRDDAGRIAFRRQIKDEGFGGEVPPAAMAELRRRSENLYETSLDGRASGKRERERKGEALKELAA